MMLLKEIIAHLENMSPLAYAEDFDNVGLLVGHPNQEIEGVLVCHDALESVVEEAVAKNCQLIVCFHPILFSGIKKITGKNYVEKAILKAIKNDIAIYAVHTALDNHLDGVNKIICTQLGIENPKILIPKENFIKKLVTYTVTENFEKLRNALFIAGAGQIGHYKNCSFSSDGYGTYQGNEFTNPAIGKRHEFIKAKEIKLEMTFEKHLQNNILQALKEHHIYEEIAYEIYTLDNKHQHIGLGMIGDLPTAIHEEEFLQKVKTTMQCGIIRHSDFIHRKIQKVAVLGGSGSFAIQAAIQAGADAFLTADLKYHQFYEAENQLLLADIGHYESEGYTKNHIVEFLSEKIPNFAIILSEENTNPVKYF